MRPIKLFLTVILILEIFQCYFSYAEDSDEWIASDKAIHLGAAFALDTAAYNYYKKNTGLDDDGSKAAAFLTVVLAGFTKEFIDNRFSWKDIGADFAGAGIGAACSIEF